MPKPVLSDSLFNADDVATAILAKANLQVANNSLGVTDITSSISIASDFVVNETDTQAFHFNGFVFLQLNIYHSGTPGDLDVIATITDANYRPNKDIAFPTIAFQADSAHHVRIKTNGNIEISAPYNASSGTFYVVTNGWYRT